MGPSGRGPIVPDAEYEPVPVARSITPLPVAEPIAFWNQPEPLK
jgi:hypothetical protein